MPRPTKLTTDQVCAIPVLLKSGETSESLAVKWGVHRRAIHYHATGGKGTRVMRELNLLPWIPHIKKARAALGKGNRAEAAAHFWKAAEHLAKAS
jgi:hypothetical protein